MKNLRNNHTQSDDKADNTNLFVFDFVISHNLVSKNKKRHVKWLQPPFISVCRKIELHVLSKIIPYAQTYVKRSRNRIEYCVITLSIFLSLAIGRSSNIDRFLPLQVLFLLRKKNRISDRYNMYPPVYLNQCSLQTFRDIHIQYDMNRLIALES